MNTASMRAGNDRQYDTDGRRNLAVGPRPACHTVPMPPRILSIILLATSAWAQTNPAATAARQWRQQHERAIVDEFVSLLAIPNIASDRANIQRNAETIAQMMGN